MLYWQYFCKLSKLISNNDSYMKITGVQLHENFNVRFLMEYIVPNFKLILLFNKIFIIDNKCSEITSSNYDKYCYP